MSILLFIYTCCFRLAPRCKYRLPDLCEPLHQLPSALSGYCAPIGYTFLLLRQYGLNPVCAGDKNRPHRCVLPARTVPGFPDATVAFWAQTQRLTPVFPMPVFFSSYIHNVAYYMLLPVIHKFPQPSDANMQASRLSDNRSLHSTQACLTFHPRVISKA